MAKKFVCEKCGGMAIEGRDEDELVQKVQDHARQAHNESAEREQILQMAETK